MTDLSKMTPAEQVRALGLAVGDTIEGRLEHGGTWVEYRRKLVGTINGSPIWQGSSIGSEFEGRWMEPTEYALPHITSDWRKISSDPTLDPTARLRAELREAYVQIESLYELADEHGYAGPSAKEWLIRNAGFGPGKGEL